MTTKKMASVIEEHDYEFPYERIKILFEERRDKVRWPENKMIAVKIIIALEWWGRIIQPAIYPVSGTVEKQGVFDLGWWSEGQGYNWDVAVYRTLDLLDRHGLKATVSCSGGGAEHHPEIIREFKEKGHVIMSHGYYQSRGASRMTLEEEREDIVKTTAILESVTGERPRGWVNSGVGCSDRTFELIVEEGYEWSSDLRDDDLPYWLVVRDKRLLIIPHRSKATGDYGWFCRGLDGSVRAQRSHREAVIFFQDTFDAYFETAQLEGAQLLSFTVHPYMTCIPERIGAFDKMLSYVKGFPEVWFTTDRKINEWWRENYL